MNLRRSVVRRGRRAAGALVRNVLARMPIRAVLAEYIHRSGLFDAYAYSEAAGLSGLSAPELVRHYLSHPGAPSPQPRFDAERYRALAGVPPHVDPFVHFALHGRADGLAANFDASAYLRDNPDVRISGWDAARHYVEMGWREGRLSPLAKQGPKLPDFTGLRGRAIASQTAVDVVMPAYRGHAETLTAIRGVLSARVAGAFRLLVIDDASPEPALSADLAALEQRGLIARMANPTNLGFTATANRGLAAAGERDVVLLNSDTEVFDDWLDRLRARACGGGNIGTVTPLSNAATILSYPIRLRDNPAPLELDYAELADLAAELTTELAQANFDIPTGVGFCLYLRRACLDAVGPFDEAAFPRGYGEENDFCLRATALGWRHLAAPDVFVKHLGSISFGAERAGLVANAMGTIETRHPGYAATIETFTGADPLAPVRTALDIRRVLAAGHSGRLIHGAPPNVRREQDLVLRRLAGRRALFRALSPRVANTPNLPAIDPVGAENEAADLLRRLAVNEIVIFEPALVGRRQIEALKLVAARINVPISDG